MWNNLQLTVITVFFLQKKIIRIMTDAQDVSNAEVYLRFCILPLAYEYILTLMTFIVGN
jgi:hypothetical protein